MIPYGKHHIDKDDIEAVTAVLKSGSLTQGPMIELFERSIADYVGANYAVAVSSGTAALHIASLAAGINSKSSLITSPITFVASANAARYCGGNVHFADIESSTVNISPNALKNQLSKNSDIKAIIPVHYAGLPCEMDKIKSLADKYDSVVIEDAAHALGAKYPSGKSVGSCENSLMTIFSFHPVKSIAAGEGGVITTNNENIYRKLIRLRSHGINKLDDPLLNKDEGYYKGKQNPWYYEMQELGFHYRTTDIQCGLALSQLKKLDLFIERRFELVKNYDLAFKELKNCCPAQDKSQAMSAHHLYVLKINFDNIGISRGEVMLKLREQGIGTQVHYIPVPCHPYYKNLGYDIKNYPNAYKFYDQALSIPLFYDLTDKQQKKVIDVIKKIIG
jgi:perosamine synthetase